MTKLEDLQRDAIQQVIDGNLEKLKAIKGFIMAEPGFRIVNGWVRREPAIIVHVAEKLPPSALAIEDLAPRQIGGVKLDIVTASPELLLATSAEFADMVAGIEAAAAGTTYQKRPGNPIDVTFDIHRPIVCHVGPDAGWPVLKRFIEGTRDTLTAAMYDINALHVAKTLIETVNANDVRFVLTWDSKMTPEESAVRADIKAKLAGRIDAWIVRTGSGWRFDSAYHQKVAVQDQRAFWLSSGNWSKRSQPEIDPIAEPASARGMYAKFNREWHIVVEHEPLSKLFEEYILYDRDQSQEEDTALALDPEFAGTASLLPDLFVPIEALAADEELALAVVEPVAPKRLPQHGKPFRVRPVLCPDNYIERITELVRSATSSLYLQFSYITYSQAAPDKPFRDLLDYIGTLSHRPDFDLRIIVGPGGAHAKVRKLVEAGFDETKIRMQGNIHNKGIIVDDKVVLISSANWSSDGALRNRDAGLVIYDPEVARYYRDVFLDDWNNRARSNFGPDLPVRLALAGDATPPGMARVRWTDFMQDD